MNGKLAALGRYLGSHAKAYAGLVGSAGTLAVTLFPSDERVQAWGGGLGILSTFLLVHITPNAPASKEQAADDDATKVLGQLVHLPSPELQAIVGQLGAIIERASEATAAAAQSAVTASPAPETPTEAFPAASDDLAHAQEAPEPTVPAADPSVPDVPGVLETGAQSTQDMPRVQPIPDETPNESAAVGQVAPSDAPSDEPPLLG